MERQQSKRQCNEGRAKESKRTKRQRKQQQSSTEQTFCLGWLHFDRFVLLFEILTAHSFSGTNKIPTIHAFRGIKNEIEERTSKSQAKICMCTCARICKTTIEKMPAKMKKKTRNGKNWPGGK